MGSAHAEKACDLIVAKLQKNRGMHWSEVIADALAAMKTVMLNQAWDPYWLTSKFCLSLQPLNPDLLAVNKKDLLYSKDSLTLESLTNNSFISCFEGSVVCASPLNL